MKVMNFLTIVTGDEIWVQFVNATTKEHSKQSMNTHFPQQAEEI
jgi:hypothetical protein